MDFKEDKMSFIKSKNTLLKIEDLYVKYSGYKTPSLKNINFEASKGELILFAGPSGCGKSTLAQTILGLIPSFTKATVSGKIIIDKKNRNDFDRNDLIKKFGYVPQYPADFTISLLVEEEIAFPLENLALDKVRINKKILEILNKLGISHLRNRLVTELSSGELQRVCLATSLVSGAPILILDEPMARIDPLTEIKIAKLLRNIADRGTLILVFEHHLDYILPMADRLVVLSENGELIADGNPNIMFDKLNGVDLPEIANLLIMDYQIQPITLEEAQISLINFLNKLNSDNEGEI